MIDDISFIHYDQQTNGDNTNSNGHKKGCRCVDCFGDFSGGDSDEDTYEEPERDDDGDRDSNDYARA